MKTIAIMQPYLFPYLGYFQLVNQADDFVVFDDVNYIKRGYVNRNNILMGGEKKRVVFPVEGASVNKLFLEVSFQENMRQVLESIRHSYNKSPHFNEVYPLIERVLRYEFRAVPQMCAYAINEIFSYLGKEVKVVFSSSLIYDRQADTEEKIIEICRSLNGSHYTNSIGGKNLYSKESFLKNGLCLNFIEMNEIIYKQGRTEFVPNLSIIDVLMWCDKSEVNDFLLSYDLS